MRWLVVLVLLTGCADDVVSIRASDGSVALRASLIGRAETAAERMEGLRARTLEPGEGLLIAFPVEDELCIVNRGVEQAIDAVFIDASANVSAVERAIAAGDGTVRCATGQWILEVLAGEAAAVEPAMVAEGL